MGNSLCLCRALSIYEFKSDRLLGNEAFPGHLAVNNQIKAFIEEGGEVYACRFALQALYGQTEKALIEGIRAINPLDVMDLRLLMRREGALIIDTWTA
ncbi:MSMEG_0572/Sll0783 family nitrogen starvation response protein [Pseudomonas aeruginosa]